MGMPSHDGQSHSCRTTTFMFNSILFSIKRKISNRRKIQWQRTGVKEQCRWSLSPRSSSAMRDGAHSRFIGEQAESAGPCHCLYAVINTQFLKDMGHMTFDGIEGNHQRPGDLLVRITPCDQKIGRASCRERV